MPEYNRITCERIRELDMGISKMWKKGRLSAINWLKEESRVERRKQVIRVEMQWSMKQMNEQQLNKGKVVHINGQSTDKCKT